MTPVLAHAGHWAVDLAIYLGPLLGIGIALWVSDRRAKRREGGGES
jgi:hypothetical protein